LARIFLLVLAHEAAEHGHRHAVVPAALGHDLDERPIRSALEQALPPLPLRFRGRSILKSGDAHAMAGAQVGAAKYTFGRNRLDGSRLRNV
jgi:hypothetical protein